MNQVEPPLVAVPSSQSLMDSGPHPLHIRFGLRGLLLVVAAASVLLAILTAFGSIWGMVLVLLFSMVAAHVLGNAIGTRLREHGSRQPRLNGPDYDTMRQRFALRLGDPSTNLVMPHYQSPSRLVTHDPLGWLPTVMTGLGSIAGATVASVGIHYFCQEFGLGDRIVAVGSFAVLGALAGFVGSTFIQVAAWPAVRFIFRRDKFRQDVGRTSPNR